ncbi:MAG: hypothetical protein ACI9MR_001213 [Myxococcota bacterium]|jgi:hypothetical protein
MTRHDMPRRTASALCALVALAFGASFSACPDLPDFGAQDADTVDPDEEVVIPLSLDRVVASLGEPLGGERVTIYGGGLTAGAVVHFGATRATNVLVLDEDRLNVDAPSHALGLVNVTVELLDGQSETLTDAYLYKSELRLDGIDPTVASTLGGVRVTLVGEGFGADSRVFVGNRALENVTIVDSQRIEGTLPAALARDAGTVDVVVTNGFEQRVLERGFRLVEPIRVDWMFPASAPTEGGTEVTLYGAGFESDAVVRVGDVAAETIVPGRGDQITFRTPPGVAGPVTLSVTNALETALADGFRYLNSADVLGVTGAFPGSGPIEGGTQVALSVTGIVGAELKVFFGETEATVIEIRALSNVVVVATPEGSEGPVTVRVEQPQSVASSSNIFRYEVTTRVDSVTPAVGSITGGTEVTLIGRRFDRAAVVTFAGVEAIVREADVGKLVVVTPPGSAGRVDITIVGSEGRTVVPAGYEYQTGGGRRLLAITPSTGSQSGGRIVRVHGSGFGEVAPKLTFGGNDAEDVRVVDDALLIARAPKGAVGNVNVRIPGVSVLAMAYQYFDPTERYGGTSGGTIPEALNITVIDAATRVGVEEAFVILWDDIGTPYQGLTDARGQLTFSDIGFGPLQMVTAAKDDYTTASIVEFDARNATLELIPLISSPPGGGGGGGPTLLEPSVLSGKVSGLDKYIVLPPGNCDSKIGSGPLCTPCDGDDECGGDGARCTFLGDQGSRCTSACEVDADCAEGYVCQGTGGSQVQCIPSPGRRAATCSVTLADVFDSPQGPGAVGVTDGNSVYQLDTEPGEYAVVCIGGYEDYDTDVFIPLLMGVRRHVFALPGAVVAQQDIRLDIPLTRDLRIRLDDAPIGAALTERHTVDVFLDLGADGVFHMPSAGDAVDVNVFDLKAFPVRFAESLYDATYTIYARAVANVPEESQTGEGIFTLHQDVTQVDDDAIFELGPEGRAASTTGVTQDVHAMHGSGNERLWAVGDEGTVLAFNGNFWGVQQTPTREVLRGIWAGTDLDGDTPQVWAVGDNGVVMRWTGLVWDPITVQVGLGNVNWEGVYGVGDEVWMWGDAGLWAHNGGSMRQVIVDITTGAIRQVWSDGTDSAWIVGDDGIIRRYLGSGGGPMVSMDRAGSDFYAIHGNAPDNVWAVGGNGRIARYNGDTWFDFIPVTRRDLHAVHAVSNNDAWAVGDAGEVLHWDGERWELLTTITHADLRGVWSTSEGVLQTGGLHTLVIGPFLRLPQSQNPSLLNGQLFGLNLRWTLEPGADASFSYVQLLHSSGFPFWSIMAEGKRTDIPLPDLDAAWGLQALWPGEGFMQIIRVFKPGFSISDYDTRVLSLYEWQSWSVMGTALSVPMPGQ